MPRRKAPRPWVVPEDARLSPAGRPRVGPRGVAVRELPRVTVRAEPQVIARWLALVDVDSRPAFEVFRDVIAAYVERLPAARRAELTRRLRDRR